MKFLILCIFFIMSSSCFADSLICNVGIETIGFYGKNLSLNSNGIGQFKAEYISYKNTFASDTKDGPLVVSYSLASCTLGVDN